MYEYRFTITSAYDGDTITGDLDMGRRVVLHDEQLRFHRINAPEIRGVERPLGLVARAFLLTKISVGSMVLVRTHLDEEEKFGRLLADIYPLGFGGYCLNDLMVETGHAVYKQY